MKTRVFSVEFTEELLALAHESEAAEEGLVRIMVSKFREEIKNFVPSKGDTND